METQLKEDLIKEKVEELTDLAISTVYNTVKLYNRGLIPFMFYPPIEIDKIYWKRPLQYNDNKYEIELSVVVYNRVNKKRTKITFWYNFYKDGRETLTIIMRGAEIVHYDYKEFVKAIKGEKD